MLNGARLINCWDLSEELSWFINRRPLISESQTTNTIRVIRTRAKAPKVANTVDRVARISASPMWEATVRKHDVRHGCRGGYRIS